MNDPETVVYCDGLCEPKNPGGVACYGWVIYWKGKRARQDCGVIASGPGATNNVAEYSAVIKALEYLLSKDFTQPIEIRSDSQLVINQLAGEWAVRSPSIYPLYEKAKELEGRFQSVRHVWVPRESNAEADMLSRKAYYEHRRENVKSPA